MARVILFAFLALLPSALAIECGAGVGSCKNNACCSVWGWCGSGADWCGVGCQKGYGRCDTAVTTTKKTTTTAAPTTAPGGTGCTWAGHCAGATCKSENDCSDDLVCTSGKCAASGPVRPTTSTTTTKPPATTSSTTTSKPTTTSSTTTSKPPATSPTTTTKSTTTTKPPNTTSTPIGNKIQVIEKCVVPGSVAITFDDGPYRWTEQIGKAFEDAGGHATFFVNGENYGCIYDYTTALQNIYKKGHQIASHTWSHADLATLTKAQTITEMTKLNVAFEKILGVVPKYMRPPFGSYIPASVDIMQELGYTYFAMWDVDSGDSMGAPVAEQRKEYDEANFVDNHVVLQHETLEDTALTMVPYAINWAKTRGYKMVTLGECLGDPKQNWYSGNGPLGTRDSTWKC